MALYVQSVLTQLNYFSSFQFQITANKMQRFSNLFIFTDALHVSDGSSAHHQEHMTVHTALAIANQYCCCYSIKFHLFHGSS
jgi:hypothetical protein